jgi:putative nucleotidyltransferase with HDIG domain
MSSYDQQHGLNVMHTLAQRGYTDPDLLAAAVLHDVGKTARKAGSLHLWHRVTVVLMRTLMPGLVEQLGEDPGGGWRQAFFVHQHHAAIGAELAQQAGCSARTVELIRHHENAPDQTDDRLLAALQAADSSN